ncbi:3933_t:CDS:2 [Ambispora leptoticha]|uniref:3933_t:CDS:1 n=1 Tax=Ambispora leptoticha TaxID=144679 RepID=A0A9N9CLB0_9GLOM|nr:3933_t:CDS:2 [Ambispora leptoticha]
MTERNNSRVRGTFQNSANSYPHGQVGDSTWFSPNPHKHILGRYSPTMGIPYQKKENDTDLSGRDARTLGGQGGVNGTETSGASKDNKPHIFNSEKEEKMAKKKSKTKKKGEKIMQKNDNESLHIHVRGVPPQSNTQQQEPGNRIESENDADVEVVSRKSCPNSGAIEKMSKSLGQLLRIGTLACTGWTTEEPTTPCRFIQPNTIFTADGVQAPVHQVSEGSGEDEPHERGKNSLMVVEKFKNESDACRIAKSVSYELINKESSVDFYSKCIKMYGFNHIIIIEEHENGLLFLDCYGRVFDWDAMVALLRPLGKNLDECDFTRLVWYLEPDTTITEMYDFE